MTAIVLTVQGMTHIADRYVDLATASGPGTATEYWIGFGTGGSSTGATATSGNTNLAAGATEARVVATVSQPSATIDQFVGTITCGRVGGFTVEEFGLFTASGASATAGYMPVRASHGGVALATGDSIAYTLQITWS